MRWLYITLILLFVAAIIIFGLQNRATIAVSFLGYSLSAPIALIAIVMYLLGTATGGSLFALLRRSWQEARLRHQ